MRRPTARSAEIARAQRHSDPATQQLQDRLHAPLPGRRASASAPQVQRGEHETVIRAGEGDDDVHVHNGENGGLRVDVNGRTINLNEAQSRRLRIQGQGGHDRIQVDEDVRHNLILEGGDGHDQIQGGAGDDIIRGGRGRDHIQGRGGDDYLQGDEGGDRLEGGAGRDVLYGLDGADQLHGGAGRDYLDGGEGNDLLSGDAGNDQLIGGRGADHLAGGDGDDVLAGGRGTDTYQGDAGTDRFFTTRGDTPVRAQPGERVEELQMRPRGQEIGRSVITNDARERSDIDALRSLPSGRALLQSLDDTGHFTRIERMPEGTAPVTWTPPEEADNRNMRLNNTVPNPTGAAGDVRYDPTYRRMVGGHHSGNEAYQNMPPLVFLYHELSHAQANGHGRRPTGRTDGERNSELAATGLPLDHDGDASTPRVTWDPINENRIRRELNLPERTRY